MININGLVDENQEIYPVSWNNVIFLGDYAEISINGQYIVLNHYPVCVWNHMHHGSWNVTSHSHGSFKESLPTDLSAKRLDVGWDVFGKPVSYKGVKEIMNKKVIIQVDHHNSETT